jgi:hypothetical protein
VSKVVLTWGILSVESSDPTLSGRKRYSNSDGIGLSAIVVLVDGCEYSASECFLRII